MRKLVAAFAAVLAASPAIAQTTIGGLPAASSVGPTDLMAVDQGYTGTGTGTTRKATVAQVLTGALQPSNNLSDLPTPSTARANLGLGATALLGIGSGLTSAGGSLSVAYGTGPGNAAQGNDSRIVGAAQVANNLSDLPSPATALATLGGFPIAGGTMTGPLTVPLFNFGTQTYAWQGVTVNTNLLPFYSSQILTGQPGSYQGALPSANLMKIRDTIDASAVTGPFNGDFIGFGINQTTGGSAADGGSHSAFRSQLLSNGYVSNIVPQLGQSGAGYRGSAADLWHGMGSNQGGTGTFSGSSPSMGWLGADKGINPYAYANTTNFNGAAEFLDRIWGEELDIQLQAGASSFMKDGLAINLGTGDAQKGYGQDDGMVISANGSADLDDVYAINPMSGSNHGATTAAQGTLFAWRQTQWPAAVAAPATWRGIDLTQGAVTDQAFATVGAGIDGSGNAEFRSVSGFGTIAAVTPSGGRGFQAVPLLTVPAAPGGGTAPVLTVGGMTVATVEVPVMQFTTTNAGILKSGNTIPVASFPTGATAASLAGAGIWGRGVPINSTISSISTSPNQITMVGNVDSVEGVPIGSTLLFANLGGSGYVVNDIVTIGSTGATAKVTNVGYNGAIQAMTLQTYGTPTLSIPANPIMLTGGKGTGGYAWISWTVASVNITTAGNGLYDAASYITYTNDTGGTGLRLRVTLGARPKLQETPAAGIVLTGNAGSPEVAQITQLYATATSGSAVRLTTDGNAATAANCMPIPIGHSLAGSLLVSMRNSGGSQTAYWHLDVMAANGAGTITTYAPATTALAPTASQSSMSTATLQVTADSANGCINITGTPPAATSAVMTAMFHALPN